MPSAWKCSPTRRRSGPLHRGWRNLCRPAIERSASAAAIGYLKQAAGLALEEKRKPQRGRVKVSFNTKRHELDVSTAGNAAGEFLKIDIDIQSRHMLKLDDLGLMPEQLETIRADVAESKGIVLVSAPKGQGQTSTMYAIIRAHDAFLQQILSIERNVPVTLEGITQNFCLPRRRRPRKPSSPPGSPARNPTSS